MIGADTATVTKNKVTNSKREGISLVDGNGRVNRNNNVTSNTVEKNKDGISLTTVVTGAGATNNTLKSNTVTRSNQFGIVADGTLNKVQRNTVSDSVVTDIKNLGTKLSYQYNVCATRSGTPVDCGVTTP